MSETLERTIEITGKKEGAPIVIFQLSDTHISAVNEEDMKNPEIADTYQHRLWLRDSEALPMLDAALEHCKDADCIVISGDVLDYYSTAAKALVRERFNRYKNVMACVGGHDLTLEMQTNHSNALTLQERYDLLDDFWCNDLQYAAKTFDDRVTVAVINNNAELWWERREPFDENQYECLKRDIEECRKNDRILLLFMHEPLQTGRGEDEVYQSVTGEEFHIRENIRPGTVSDQVYQLIIRSADVIKGVFVGHYHVDADTEIEAGCEPDGTRIKENVPMYFCPCNIAGKGGAVLKIVVNGAPAKE